MGRVGIVNYLLPILSRLIRINSFESVVNFLRK